LLRGKDGKRPALGEGGGEEGGRTRWNDRRECEGGGRGRDGERTKGIPDPREGRRRRREEEEEEKEAREGCEEGGRWGTETRKATGQRGSCPSGVKQMKVGRFTQRPP